MNIYLRALPRTRKLTKVQKIAHKIFNAWWMEKFLHVTRGESPELLELRIEFAKILKGMNYEVFNTSINRRK